MTGARRRGDRRAARRQRTVAEIERLRRQRLSGPRIARRLGLPVSTVGAVLRRLGLGRLTALDERPEIVRYERAAPGELIHIDTKKLGRIDGIGHRITGERTTAQAQARLGAPPRRHRRLLAARLHRAPARRDRRGLRRLPRPRRRLLRRHGVTVRRVMTDNAFAYTKSRAFKATLAGIGARHIPTRPYTPRTNGKAERFIQTAFREWLYARRLHTIRRANRRHARLAPLVQSPQTPLSPQSHCHRLQG